MKIAINATYNPSGGARVMLINMLKFFQDEKDIFVVIYIRKQDLALLEDYDKKKLKVVISKIAGISTSIRVSWEQLTLPFLLKKEKVDILFLHPGFLAVYLTYNPGRALESASHFLSLDMTFLLF